MKLIAILLSLCLSANVFANEGVVRAFETELDSYQYSLTVDWDQTNEEFAEAKTKDFLNSMDQMMARGLTIAQVMAVLEKRVSDKAALDSIKQRLSLAAKVNNQEELIHVIQDASSDLYARGASWNGAAVAFYGGFGLLIVSVMAYSFWFNNKYECAEWSSESRHNICERYEEKQ